MAGSRSSKPSYGKYLLVTTLRVVTHSLDASRP